MRSHEEIQDILDHLPNARPKPCAECPWRRNAVSGHLGPHSATEWLNAVHGEGPIACHMTITVSDDWSTPGLRQCTGSAIYRTNVHKLPHHPNVATSDEPDHQQVFSADAEFLDHHEGV